MSGRDREFDANRNANFGIVSRSKCRALIASIESEANENLKVEDLLK